jgi:broad specificity phosphatase PhoE
VLIVVRHGQTGHNAGRLLSGRGEAQLDAEGERQARALGACLAHPGRVVCSPLARARATAAAITEVAGGPAPEVDERWIELDYGEWEGAPLAEVPRAAWAEWMADPHFRPPGGETLAELDERVAAACSDVAVDAADEDVVVVTHVSPIKAAVTWALGSSDALSWRLHVATASITRIAMGGRGPVLHTFNETQHLR